MNRWLAVTVCAIVACIVVTQWPEIERYRRIRAM